MFRCPAERLSKLILVHEPVSMQFAIHENHRDVVSVLARKARHRVHILGVPLDAFGRAHAADHLAGVVTEVTASAGEQPHPRGQGLLASAAALDPGLLEQLAVLLLRHPLAALLDDRTHVMPLHMIRGRTAAAKHEILAPFVGCGHFEATVAAGPHRLTERRAHRAVVQDGQRGRRRARWRGHPLAQHGRRNT